MKTDFIVDWISCILFKSFGCLIRKLPIGFIFFLGRRLGEFLYFVDAKHRAVGYANMKTALGRKYEAAELNNRLVEFYRSFGQTLMEIFLFPSVDRKYIDKYISLIGMENVEAGFKKGKGVIFAVAHEGSWEISNIISANLGYPFNVVVREQPKYRRLNSLFNLYRSQKGSKLIETKDSTRKIIEALKRNEAVAITVDQGGRAGCMAKFFGKNASMGTGAVRLALKYDATIIPVFSVRLSGPYIKFNIEPPFEIKKTSDREKDIEDNVQRLVSIFEKYITRHPKEYLWTYKIWKYSNEKNILILSDGKAGHLRQSQALSGVIESYLKEKGLKTDIKIAEIKSGNRFCAFVLTLCALFSGKHDFRRFWQIRPLLKKDDYEFIWSLNPDIVISCASTLAGLNLMVSGQNRAKSAVIMKSSILNTRRFDLVVMSRHDNPAKKKNTVIIDGALNLISEEYLKSMGDALKSKVKVGKKLVLGLLIGGDSKGFKLDKDLIKEALTPIKSSLDKLDGEILVTTSRRTSAEVESLLKDEFGNYSRCRLLVIANENNFPEAVGGILALSSIVIVSPESISMISEAASSGKYVLVLESCGLGAKHDRFLELFAGKKYIFMAAPGDLSGAIENFYKNSPQVLTPKDNLLAREAAGSLL